MHKATYSINGKDISVTRDSFDHAKNAELFQLSTEGEMIVPYVYVGEDGKVEMPSLHLASMSHEEMLAAVIGFYKDTYHEGAPMLPPHPLVAGLLELESDVDPVALTTLAPMLVRFDDERLDPDVYNALLLPWRTSSTRELELAGGYKFELCDDDAMRLDGDAFYITQSHYFNPDSGTLCLGHDWYDGGVAPSPIQGVNTSFDIAPPQIIGGLRFEYHINLDERGSFLADVRDADTEATILTIKDGDELAEGESSIFEDGFMANRNDIEGLTEYLRNIGLIPKDAVITSTATSTVTPKRGPRV